MEIPLPEPFPPSPGAPLGPGDTCTAPARGRCPLGAGGAPAGAIPCHPGICPGADAKAWVGQVLCDPFAFGAGIPPGIQAGEPEDSPCVLSWITPPRSYPSSQEWLLWKILLFLFCLSQKHREKKGSGAGEGLGQGYEPEILLGSRNYSVFVNYLCSTEEKSQELEFWEHRCAVSV